MDTGLHESPSQRNQKLDLVHASQDGKEVRDLQSGLLASSTVALETGRSSLLARLLLLPSCLVFGFLGSTSVLMTVLEHEILEILS